jgi:hypothetical protein
MIRGESNVLVVIFYYETASLLTAGICQEKQNIGVGDVILER